MKKREGSAIVVVLGVLVVLVVLSVSVMENKSKRAGFTRYMSNEKKAEAFAEAILDCVISNIRENANDNEKKDKIYELLRKPYPNPGQSEENQVVPSNESADVPEDYFKAITSSFPSDEGTYTLIDNKVTAEIIHTETFGGEYKVVGVDIAPGEHKTSYITDGGKANPNNDNWKFNFMYPATKNSDVNEINNKYSDNEFKSGIYNAYNGTYINSSVLSDTYLNYRYVSLPLDINLELKGNINDIVNDSRFDSGVDKGLFEKTQVNLLLKEEDGESSKTAAEFGVYLTPDLLDNIKKLVKNIIQYIDDNSTKIAIGKFLGNDEAEDAEAQKEKLQKILDDGDLEPKKFNEKLNEKLKEVINDSGASEYIHDNKFDLEKIMSDKIALFKEIKPIVSSEMLKNLQGSGNVNSSWVTDASKASEGYSDPQLVEKGGVLRLSCKVEYTPTGKTAIKKKLVCEIPFKVSDVMPIAPSHTFFVANSSNIGAADGVGTIKLSGDGDGTSNFILCNGNRSETGFEDGMLVKYGIWKDSAPEAGKVRINGEIEKPLDTNCGGLEDKVKYSDIPMFCVTKSTVTNNPGDVNLQFKVTFGFKNDADGEDFLNPGKIHVPVLQTADCVTKNETGFTNIVNMFKSMDDISNITTAPTFLYGYGHLDYPLGITIEGKAESKISELFAHIDPQLTLSVDMDEDGKFDIQPVGNIGDDFNIFYKIKNIDTFPSNDSSDTPIAYGLPNINDSKKELDEYAPTEENMPDFLYSDKQYRKKASRFYKDQGHFKDDMTISIKDGGLKDDDGKIHIDGVIYIDGDLDLEANPYIGNGLIVATNISIDQDIKLEDDDSSLGLIARLGTLSITNCTVNASCYSNNSPILTDATIIGNLVTNGFNRSDIKGNDTQVVYCSKNIVVPDTSFKKLYTEENPRRYYASFANNWSKSYYDKNVDK